MAWIDYSESATAVRAPFGGFSVEAGAADVFTRMILTGILSGYISPA
jgi:hypothetical protein